MHSLWSIFLRERPACRPFGELHREKLTKRWCKNIINRAKWAEVKKKQVDSHKAVIHLSIEAKDEIKEELEIMKKWHPSIKWSKRWYKGRAWNVKISNIHLSIEAKDDIKEDLEIWKKVASTYQLKQEMVEFKKGTHLSIKAKDYIKEEHEIKKNIYDSNFCGLNITFKLLLIKVLSKSSALVLR